MALDYEIKSVRLEPAEDNSHLHVVLVGYESLHTPGEPIMIEIPRVLQKMAFAEQFHVTIDGERAEIAEGKCLVCGFEPYLKTSKDTQDHNFLLDLPET